VQGSERTPPRVAFVNGGILGLGAYATWLRQAFADNHSIRAEHFVLTEGMTPVERAIRRVMCQRFWSDSRGRANLDLARFRQELHAGVQARRRLLARGLGQFDVLHFHRQSTAYASLDLMDRVPAIVSIDCTQSCITQDLTGRLERWTIGFNRRRDGEIFRRAAAIVSTSHWAERKLRADHPDCEAPVHVLSPPIPFDLFGAEWLEERFARANQGGLPQLLFMGGDFPRKGGYDLLSAWSAAQLYGKAELTMVTDWVVDVPLPPGVRIVSGIRGYTAEWVALWRSIDVFVMPTRNEAFGLVYQEAASAGVPAIGSCLNAVPEIIEHDRTGLLVEPGDQPGLVRALQRLIAAPELRREMGRAARAAVERQADPDAHRQRLLDLIESIRRSGPPARRRTS
jgi:alpha-maltose-1-phosphate synthase